MKFSFIIPALNEQGYIEKCLASIKKQEINDYEIIVVDSYSSDATLKAAKRYKCRIFFEKRRGPAIARNTGAKRAKGMILVFADADVVFEKDFLGRIERHFEKHIGGGVCRLSTYDAWHFSHALVYEFANALAKFFNRLGIVITGGSCFVYTKKAFDAVGGFDPKFITNEDHDLARRVSKIKRFMFFDDVVVGTSARRIRSKGLFNIIRIYIKSTLVYFLNNGWLRDYW